MSHERLRPRYFFDEEKIAQLKQIAPECFEDGKINFETLRQNLGEWAQDEEDPELEHFGLFWPGKRDARRAAAIPPQGALEPVWGQGLKADGTPDTDGTNDSKNIFIEGENLEVLKLLQKSYAGKVKMIYIDPPYNTGNDFVYDDDFTEPLQEYLRRTGQVDEEGKPMTTNKRSDGRFHSKWLSMMYPRLRLARNLLREDGVIFVSIDDNEVQNLRAIMNEIFGEENFIECLIWNKRIPKNDKGIGSIHEYILLYVKNKELKHEFLMGKEGLEDIEDLLLALKKRKTPIEEAEKEVRKLYKKKGYDRGITLYNSLDNEYRLWGKINMSWPNADTFGPTYEVIHPATAKPVKIPDRGWRWKQDTFNEAAGFFDGKYQDVVKLHDGTYKCGRIWFSNDENMQPSSISYLDELDKQLLRSIISLKSDGGIEVERLFDGKSYFSYPKPTSLINTLIKSIPIRSKDIVLDFFAGSGTSAHVALDMLKDAMPVKFIAVQLPEVLDETSEAHKAGYHRISSITIERIRRVSASLKTENVEGDLGVKVLSLRTSNYKIWKNVEGTSIEQLETQLGMFNENPLVEDVNKDGLLTEIMLLEGFTLCSSIMPMAEIKANSIKKVSSEYCDHSLLVCLDEKIAPETVAGLQLKNGDIFICLDSAISNVDKLRLSDKGLIKTI